jgi:hypothetical protein
VILTPSKSSAVTAIPNAIPIDGLKINKPVVAEIEHYRAFFAGSKHRGIR